MADQTKTKVTTPPGILSYPNLFTPRAVNPDDEPKYSLSLVIDEETQANGLNQMKQAALAAAQERFGANALDQIRAGAIKWPFRNGASREGKPYGPGTVFVNMNSKRQPGIVSKYAQPGTNKPMPITEGSGEIYAGCIVRVSCNAFAYQHPQGGKGVSFGLNNVQKLDDGERLDGAIAAEDDFEALEEQPVADLGAMDDVGPATAGNSHGDGSAPVQQPQQQQKKPTADNLFDGL